MNDKAEIYLRVYRDMPFMLEIISRCGEQADSFTAEMLFQRIILERNAFAVEENQRRERDKERQITQEELRERKSDD